jgi:hypothetical protein
MVSAGDSLNSVRGVLVEGVVPGIWLESHAFLYKDAIFFF